MRSLTKLLEKYLVTASVKAAKLRDIVDEKRWVYEIECRDSDRHTVGLAEVVWEETGVKVLRLSC